MSNYNTTNGLPYTRIPEISIKDFGNGNLQLEYYEKLALLDANGTVHHLLNDINKFTLDLSKIQEPVQAVDPVTGDDIPGLSFTQNQIFLGIIAFIRQDQKRREAANA